MKIIAAILLLIVSSVAVRAGLDTSLINSARSLSGQFVVNTVNAPVRVTTPRSVVGDDSLVFTPQLLVVTCERVKHAVWRELGVTGNWSGKIFIALRPARDADESVTVVCSRFRDGWGYQLEMPQTVERRRFMRAIVQTLLLELANRNGGERSAEIPSWLTEGIVEKLLASNETEMLPPAPEKSVHGVMVSPRVENERRADPLEAVRHTLRKHPQLTLEQLSWPGYAQLTGQDGGVYRGSAQLFTMELLRFKDGPACMRTMLDELARCYNWQTAFLRAFKPHFTQLLDVEKWWTLQAVYLTGRDPSRLWTHDESRRKLDDILLMSAQVRRQADELPAHAELSLQTVIAEWDFASQKKALNQAVRSLEFLRVRLSPELVPLSEEYRRTLEDYLKQRGQAAFTLPGSRRPGPTVKGAVREAVKQLDALDEKRTALKPVQASAR